MKFQKVTYLLAYSPTRLLAHVPARSLARVLVGVVLVLLLGAVPAMAQREIDEQIDEMLKKKKRRPDPVFVGLHLGWSGTFRPGRWVPMHLFVDAPDKPVGGVLTLDVPQDSFHRMLIEQDYALTPGSQLQMVLYGQLGTVDDLFLRLKDQSGRTRLDRRIGNAELLSNPSGQMLVVGVVGDRTTIESRQGQFAQSDSDTREWVARWEAEARLPRIWVGYDVLDALVLANPNWSLISPEAGEAIAHWVERGGRLLLYSSEAPPADHPLRKLLPLEIGDPKRVEVSQAVTLKIGTRFTPATSAVVSELDLQPSAQGWTRLRDGDSHYLAGGSVGFGWVSYLSVHPTDLVVGRGGEPRTRGADVGEAKRFVGELIDRTLERSLAEPVPISLMRRDKNNTTNYGWNAGMLGSGGLGEMAASSVLNVLSEIPGIGPISFLWIGGLLTSLLVLLGPVDYFALRRMGRLPWTWFTVTGYIVLFSAIGFWIAHTRRLGTTQVRRASVVDSVLGQPTAYQTGVTVVYASRSASYQPDDPRRDRWWSAYLPRDQFGYGFDTSRAGTQRIFYRQGRGCAITGLPIPVANIRCLRDQSTAEPLEVTLRRSRDGSGYELVNREAFPIKSGQLFELQGQQVMVSSFRRVGPEATVRVENPSRPVNASNPLFHAPEGDEYFSRFYSGDVGGNPGSDPPVPRNALARLGDASSRARGIFAWLRSGALLLWVEVEAPVDFTLRDAETKDYHLQLHRVVIPRETMEGAQQAAASQPRKEPQS